MVTNFLKVCGKNEEVMGFNDIEGTDPPSK